MLEKHTTATGHQLLIAEMSDEHLQNTVKLILAGIEQRNKALSSANGLTEYQAKLYGVEVADAAAVAKKNRSAIQRLYPYLAELYLRGLHDLVPAVQSAVGRASWIVTTTSNLLASGDLPGLSAEQMDSLITSLGVDITDL